MPLSDTSGSSDSNGDRFPVGLTEDEQRELLTLARQMMADKLQSRSRLRHLGEPAVETIAEMEQATGANAHLLLTERLAVEYGDPLSIQLLQQVASIASTSDRSADAALARRILENVSPK